MIEGADIVLYAPPSELREDAGVRPNAARKRRTVARKVSAKFPYIPSVDYERLLVRTAIIRSSTFDESKLPTLGNPFQAALLLEHMMSADQEYLVTIAIDASNQVVGIHETSVGPAGYTSLSPADVVKIPILCGVRYFIIAHNHPSGTPRPSEEDVVTMQRLEQGAEFVGVQMLDSLIITYNGVYSFQERRKFSWEWAKHVAGELA